MPHELAKQLARMTCNKRDALAVLNAMARHHQVRAYHQHVNRLLADLAKSQSNHKK